VGGAVGGATGNCGELKVPNWVTWHGLPRDSVTPTGDVCYRHYWRHRWRQWNAMQCVTSLRLVPPSGALRGHEKDRETPDGGRCDGGRSAQHTRTTSSALVCSLMARAGTCWWRHWAMTSAPCPPPPANADTWYRETEHCVAPPINQIVWLQACQNFCSGCIRRRIFSGLRCKKR